MVHRHACIVGLWKRLIETLCIRVHSETEEDRKHSCQMFLKHAKGHRGTCAHRVGGDHELQSQAAGIQSQVWPSMALRESRRLSVLGVCMYGRHLSVVLHIWLNWDVITSSAGNWTQKQKRLILAAFFWSSAFFVYGGWMPPPSISEISLFCLENTAPFIFDCSHNISGRALPCAS